MRDEKHLPVGWKIIKLGDLTEPSKEKVNPQDVPGVPYIGLEHIEKETGRLLECASSNDVRSTKSVFQPGDLLYGKLRPYLNKVYIPDFHGVCSTDILVFPRRSTFSNRFLYYRFLSGDFVRYANQNVSGVQHPRVSPTKLAEFKIHLPPLPEQERIVAKIEELFTQLDAGVAELQQAKVQLQRYRQAVLKAAVSGELTRAWREVHKEELEPAQVLLERILAERRRKWEEEGKKGKYKEPAAPDVDGLPELPDGWVWISLDQLLGKIEAGKSFKSEGRPANVDEYGVIKVSAMSWGKFLPGENKALYPDTDVRRSSSLKAGDLLISRANTIELVGAVVLIERDYPNLLLSDKSLRLIFTSKETDKRFILYALRSPWVRHVYERLATGTSDSMRNLSQPKIRSAPIALPSYDEQKRIASKLERRLSVADEIETELDQAMTRAKRLRQSILKRAFEGRLLS